MINVILYKEDKKSLWNNFNKNAKNGIFMFDRNYMDYHSDRFRDNSLMFYNGDELVALLPLNKKENKLISHEGLTFGGFITNSKMKPQIMLECFESLREYMLRNGCSTLLYKVLPHIYHTLPAEDDLYALFRNKAFIYKVEPSNTINLQEPIKISRGRKPHISRAKREGVETFCVKLVCDISSIFVSYFTFLNVTAFFSFFSKRGCGGKSFFFFLNHF